MSIEMVLGLDLETTGLDEEEDYILEVAAKVVAPNYAVAAQGRWVLFCDEAGLARMSPAVRAQHEKSGLLAEVRASTLGHEHADEFLSEFVKVWWPESKPMLLGNSIHFDRRFIRHDMPKTEKLLHYRMIDVSAIREAVRVFGCKHRADVDVDNSIAELKHMMGRLK